VNPLLFIVPILAVMFAVAYGAFHALGRIWTEHKIRLALLERVQEKPELIEPFQELQDLALTANPAAWKTTDRQNYTLTGGILSIIGIGCGVAGRALRVGQLAVGLYTGGLICIGLGVLLALIGIAIQWLSRNPIPPPKKK